jgi:integrase/recombinase XerD
VDAPRKGRALPKVLSRAEVEALIAAASARDGAQGLRLACLVEILYAAGLRVSELTSLTLSAVGARPGLSDGQGQGRQGAAGAAEHLGAGGDQGLSGDPAAVPAGEGQGQSVAVSVTGRDRR